MTRSVLAQSHEVPIPPVGATLPAQPGNLLDIGGLKPSYEVCATPSPDRPAGLVLLHDGLAHTIAKTCRFCEAMKKAAWFGDLISSPPNDRATP